MDFQTPLKKIRRSRKIGLFPQMARIQWSWVVAASFGKGMYSPVCHASHHSLIHSVCSISPVTYQPSPYKHLWLTSPAINLTSFSLTKDRSFLPRVPRRNMGWGIKSNVRGLFLTLTVVIEWLLVNYQKPIFPSLAWMCLVSCSIKSDNKSVKALRWRFQGSFLKWR